MYIFNLVLMIHKLCWCRLWTSSFIKLCGHRSRIHWP